MALAAGRDPIAEAATPVGLVDGMASDGAGQGAFHPYAEIRSKAILELRLRTGEKQADFVDGACPIHPWEPLAQMIAVPIDSREQDFGVVPHELSQFEALGNRAPIHCVPPKPAPFAAALYAVR